MVSPSIPYYRERAKYQRGRTVLVLDSHEISTISSLHRNPSPPPTQSRNLLVKEIEDGFFIFIDPALTRPYGLLRVWLQLSDENRLLLRRLKRFEKARLFVNEAVFPIYLVIGRQRGDPPCVEFSRGEEHHT